MAARVGSTASWMLAIGTPARSNIPPGEPNACLDQLALSSLSKSDTSARQLIQFKLDGLGG